MARRRILRPEETELWQTVARTARPLHADPPADVPPGLPPTAASQPPLADPAPRQRLPMFTLGEKARSTRPPDTALHIAPGLRAPPLQMDAKTHARMTRGKLSPESRIDLHGMTLAEAHPELIRFVLNAHSAGMRLVLVITGKGKLRADHGPIPQRMGILRHQVPQWLRLPPLGPAVLQVTEAHLRHGGAGALYVYLRR